MLDAFASTGVTSLFAVTLYLRCIGQSFHVMCMSKRNFVCCIWWNIDSNRVWQLQQLIGQKEVLKDSMWSLDLILVLLWNIDNNSKNSFILSRHLVKLVYCYTDSVSLFKDSNCLLLTITPICSLVCCLLICANFMMTLFSSCFVNLK